MRTILAACLLLVVATGCLFQGANSDSSLDSDFATAQAEGLLTPIPTPRSLSTPVPPTMTFSETRETVIEYLSELNSADNDFVDSLSQSQISAAFSSGDAIAVNGALNTYLQISQGYVARINDLTPLAGVDDLAELDNLHKEFAGLYLKWVQDLRSAVIEGDSDKTQQVYDELTDIVTDSTFDRMDDLQQSVLARFNITDESVNYVRPSTSTNYDTEAQTVQAAMDLYMADNLLFAITANNIATSDFGSSNPALYPNYLRNRYVQCSYTWNSTGTVYQAYCP